MDILTVLGAGSIGAGLLKSLFGKKQDPYAEQRKQMQQLIAQIQTEFPRLREAMQSREAIQRGGLVRQQQDFGASAGLPQNVIAQNINQASLGSLQNLNEALGNLNIQKMNTLQNLVGLTGQLPPQPYDTSAGDLLGTGLQSLLAFSQPNNWAWLTKLFGGGGGGVQPSPLNVNTYRGW